MAGAGDNQKAGSAKAMIVGTGVDLTEVERMRGAMERHGSRFAERVFTPGEIDYAERHGNRYERYAARFAAKEAAMKALGTGWQQGVRFQDCEVVNLASGRPTLVLRGAAAEHAARLGVARIWLSLTHTSRYGLAQVVLESQAP